MTDLDQRLRADASRRAAATADVRPPDLARALDTALERRMAPAGWLAAAAAVVLLVGLAVVLAVKSGGHDRGAPASVPSISGVPARRGDLVLTRVTDAGVATVFLVPGDPRALDVLVPYSRQADGCSLYRPAVDVVAETAGRVRLRASGYEYASKPDKGGYPGFSCNEDRTRPVRVRLDAPLGDRAVLGSDTGTRRARVIDPSDAPQPSYLPPGYDAWRKDLPDARTGSLSSSRLYRHGDDTLSIDAGAPTDVPHLDGPVRGHADVHGVRATLVDSAGESCLSWELAGGRERIVCSEAVTPLGPAVLLRVARSLR